MTSRRPPPADSTTAIQTTDSDCSKSRANDGVITRELRAEGSCGQNAGHVTFDPRDLSHANLGISPLRSNFPSLSEKERDEDSDPSELGLCSNPHTEIGVSTQEPQLCAGLDKEALFAALSTCFVGKSLSFSNQSEAESDRPQPRGLKPVLDTVFESSEPTNGRADESDASDEDKNGGNTVEDSDDLVGSLAADCPVNSKVDSPKKSPARRPTPSFFPSIVSNSRQAKKVAFPQQHPTSAAKLPYTASSLLTPSNTDKAEHSLTDNSSVSLPAVCDERPSPDDAATGRFQTQNSARVSVSTLAAPATGDVQDGRPDFRNGTPLSALPPIAERPECDVSSSSAVLPFVSAGDSLFLSGERKLASRAEGPEAFKEEPATQTADSDTTISEANFGSEIISNAIQNPDYEEGESSPPSGAEQDENNAMSRSGGKLTSITVKQSQRRPSPGKAAASITSGTRSTNGRSEKAQHPEAAAKSEAVVSSVKQRTKGVAAKENAAVPREKRMSGEEDPVSNLCNISQLVVVDADDRSDAGVTGALSVQQTNDASRMKNIQRHHTVLGAAAYDVSMDDDNSQMDINDPGISSSHPEPQENQSDEKSKHALINSTRTHMKLSNSECCHDNDSGGSASLTTPKMLPGREDRSQSDPSVIDFRLSSSPTEGEGSSLQTRLWYRSATDVRKPTDSKVLKGRTLLMPQSNLTLSPSRKVSLAMSLEDNSDRIRRNSVSILPPLHDRAQAGSAVSPAGSERVVPVPKRKSSSKEQLLKVLDTGPQALSVASTIASSLEFFTWTHLSSTLSPEDLRATSVARTEVQVTLPVCYVTQNGNTVMMTTVEAIQETLTHLRPNLQVLMASAQVPETPTAGGAFDKGGGAVPVPAVSLLPADTDAGDSSNTATEPVSPAASEDASDEMADLQATSTYTFGTRRRSSSQTRASGIQENTRRSSINTCIRDMREQSSNYSSQLTGVQIVGHYANDETLKVVLAKPDAISCVIAAMKAFLEKEELQRQACVSLLKMASASEANCVHISKNDGVAAIANTMRRYDDSLELTRLTLSILGYMSTADGVTEDLIRHCCHRDVLSAMSRHSDDRVIVRQCCFVLGNLVITVETAEQLMLIGGVHTIISMIKLYSDDKGILENGCRALGSFAVYDETCLDVAQAGATETVVEAMKSIHSNENIKESGCWALACLTCTANTCEVLVTLGGLDVLLDTLEKFPGEELLQDYGVRALCNLGTQETTLQHVSTARVVKVLISLCRNFPENVEALEVVMIALGQVAACELEVHRCLLHDGGVRSVVAVMKSFPENRTIQENGCRILGNMAVHEHLRKATEQQGASQAVISAMLNMEMFADVQLYGCMALMNLTADLMDNKMRVKNNGAVPTLLFTIRHFPDNPEVVLSALKTLGNLVDLEECCRQLLDDRGLPTVISIATNVKADDSIRAFAALVLAGITALADLPKDDLMRIERTLVALQAALPHDPDLALSMCQGLNNLLKTEAGLNTLMKEGWLDVIVSTMAHFETELDIHLTSCRIIASVAMESRKHLTQDSCPLTECTVRTVLKSIRAFPDEKELQMVGCGVLSCICENFGDLRSVIVPEGGVRDVTKAMTRFPTDDRLHAVGHIALAYLLPIDSEKNPEDAAMVLSVIGKSMSQFVENEELQVSGCRALVRCDITGMNDIFEALTYVRNAMRRHSDSDKVLQAAAKVFKRLGGDDWDTLVEKFVNAPTPVRKVFWNTLQE